MLYEQEDFVDINELEVTLISVIHPLNLFDGWSEEEFREWLKIDMYGNTQPQPNEKDVVNVLNMVEGYPELEYLYDICLQELIKIKNNES